MQLLGRLNLKVTEARRCKIDKFLTAKMQVRLRSEHNDQIRRRKRNVAIANLDADINKLVGEERKTRSARLNLTPLAGGEGKVRPEEVQGLLRREQLRQERAQ